MVSPNNPNFERSGHALPKKLAAAISTVCLALTGCTTSAAEQPTPTTTSVAPSETPSAQSSPTPETSPIAEPFDPTKQTEAIEIRKKFIQDYLATLTRMDGGDYSPNSGGTNPALPKNILLAGSSENANPGTLEVATNGKSFTVTGTNDNGVDFVMKRSSTGKKVLVERPGYTDLTWEETNQVVTYPSVGVAIICASGWQPSIRGDGDDNEATWKSSVAELRKITERAKDYSPGGTNELGNEVEPDPDILLPITSIAKKSPFSDSSEVTPTYFLTTVDGNTIGIEVAYRKPDHNNISNKIRALSPAEIAKLAAKHGVEVSSGDLPSYPKNDIELYHLAEAAMDTVVGKKESE